MMSSGALMHKSSSLWHVGHIPESRNFMDAALTIHVDVHVAKKGIHLTQS